MPKSLTFAGLLWVCCAVPAQEILYTISGNFERENLALDSILFENLSNKSRILFDDLPAQEYYFVHLANQESIQLEEFAKPEITSGFVLHGRSPGLLGIESTMSYEEDVRFYISDIKGRILYASSVEGLTAGSLIHVDIPNEGIYVVKIITVNGSTGFRAIGSARSGPYDIIVEERGVVAQRIAKKSVASGNNQELTYLKGDTIRASVYRDGYYARPLTFTISNSMPLEFVFLSGMADNFGVSDAFITLDSAAVVSMIYNASNGQITLDSGLYSGGLHAGDILTVDSDTTGSLRKVTGISYRSDTVIIETEQAYLNDVFVDMALKLSTRIMEPDDTLDLTSSPPEVYDALIDNEGYLHPVEVVFFNKEGVTFRQNVLAENGFETASGSTLKINSDLSNTKMVGPQEYGIHCTIDEGYASFSSDAILEFQFIYAGELVKDTKIKKGRLQSFNYYLAGTANINSKNSMSSLDPIKNLRTKKRINQVKATAKYILRSGIPIWITLATSLYGDLLLAADSPVNADWGYNCNHSIGLGAGYNHSTGKYTPYYEYTPGNSVYPLSTTGELNATSRFSICPQVAMQVYDHTGPFAMIDPFVTTQYTGSLQAQLMDSDMEDFLAWNSQMNLGLNLTVGMDLSFAGLQIDEYSPVPYNCFDTLAWESPKAIEPLAAVPEDVPSNSTQTMSFKVIDLSGNPVQFCTLFISGGGHFNRNLLTTNSLGEVEVEWTLPDSAGSCSYVAQLFDSNNEEIFSITGSTNVVENLPEVSTLGLVSKTDVSALVNSSVPDDGGSPVSEKGICCGTLNNPTIHNFHTSDGGGVGTFTSQIGSLAPNTTYYCRAYATNGNGTAYGNQISFTTDPTWKVPDVQTNVATFINDVSAGIGGNVIHSNGPAVTETGIYWGTTPHPEVSGEKFQISNGVGEFSSTLSGLSPDSVYFIVAYAINSIGEAQGTEKVFKILEERGNYTLIDIEMADYFVAPWGDDGDNGSYTNPWATWKRAWTTIMAGDKVYVRGGVYELPFNTGLGLYRDRGIGTKEKPIEIFNFPGEHPVLDCSTGDSTTLRYILYLNNSEYWHIKGLEVRNADRQGMSNVAFTIMRCDQIILENCVAANISGTGIIVTGEPTGHVIVKNCDSSGNYDENLFGQNADGFRAGSKSRNSLVEFIGCRSWNNSDDGYDLYYNEGTVIFDSCWAFSNGYAQGDGSGFKLGGTFEVPLSTYQRVLTNCVTYNNRHVGFDQNAGLTKMLLYNNISYNDAYRGFAFNSGSGEVIIRNNISYKHTVPDAFGYYVVSDHNDWDLGITVSDTDFLSLDPTDIMWPRDYRGRLKNLDFLQLAPGSDLINAGTDVGIPFRGAGPDLGPYEAE